MAVATKTINLRWATTCAACTSELPAGTAATWSRTERRAYCLDCTPTDAVDAASLDPAPEDRRPLDHGEAGASARREYERRSAREAKRKQQKLDDDREWRSRVKAERPVLGRLATALTPKPNVAPGESHATNAWKTGEAGERRVAEILEGCRAIALHDRRVPGSRANIDHLAVGPRGVFAIDAKKYKGRIEKRDVGSFFRVDERLYVRGRDQSRLVAGVEKQCEVVRTALGDRFGLIPVYGVLCFVEADWGLRMRRIEIDGVTCIWPKGLPGVVDAAGTLDSDACDDIARHLAETLKPA